MLDYYRDQNCVKKFGKNLKKHAEKNNQLQKKRKKK